MRIFRKNRTEAVPSALNIVGLALAFAALYIILVQVHHDLSYNKGLKDSDRIYCMMVKDQFSDNDYSCWMKIITPPCTTLSPSIAPFPSVPAYGMAEA